MPASRKTSSASKHRRDAPRHPSSRDVPNEARDRDGDGNTFDRRTRSRPGFQTATARSNADRPHSSGSAPGRRIPLKSILKTPVTVIKKSQRGVAPSPDRGRSHKRKISSPSASEPPAKKVAPSLASRRLSPRDRTSPVHAESTDEPQPGPLPDVSQGATRHPLVPPLATRLASVPEDLTGDSSLTFNPNFPEFPSVADAESMKFMGLNPDFDLHPDCLKGVHQGRNSDKAITNRLRSHIKFSRGLALASAKNSSSKKPDATVWANDALLQSTASEHWEATFNDKGLEKIIEAFCDHREMPATKQEKIKLLVAQRCPLFSFDTLNDFIGDEVKAEQTRLAHASPGEHRALRESDPEEFSRYVFRNFFDASESELDHHLDIVLGKNRLEELSPGAGRLERQLHDSVKLRPASASPSPRRKRTSFSSEALQDRSSRFDFEPSDILQHIGAEVAVCDFDGLENGDESPSEDLDSPSLSEEQDRLRSSSRSRSRSASSDLASGHSFSCRLPHGETAPPPAALNSRKFSDKPGNRDRDSRKNNLSDQDDFDSSDCDSSSHDNRRSRSLSRASRTGSDGSSVSEHRSSSRGRGPPRCRRARSACRASSEASRAS